MVVLFSQMDLIDVVPVHTDFPLLENELLELGDGSVHCDILFIFTAICQLVGLMNSGVKLIKGI